MAVNLSLARKLCTASELELLRWTQPASLKKAPPSRLRLKADRARKLADKYRDLARRQKREARGKQPPRGRRPSLGADNTLAKAGLFAEALAVFQARLADIEKTQGPGRR